MAYTADKPPLPSSSEELRARIPGWGVDLDPKDRPSVPKEQFDPQLNGAHWDFPERQPEKWPRERSVEHKFLTPVFGTSCPPKGISGVMRKQAYKYSEGRAAHWLILLAADRVDAVESHLRSFADAAPGQPDHPDRGAERVHPPRHRLTPRPKTRRPQAPTPRPDHRRGPMDPRRRRRLPRRQGPEKRPPQLNHTHTPSRPAVRSSGCLLNLAPS